MKFIVTQKQEANRTINTINRDCRRAVCTYDHSDKVWQALYPKDFDLQDLIAKGFIQIVADDYSAAPQKTYSSADRAIDDKEFFDDQGFWPAKQ